MLEGTTKHSHFLKTYSKEAKKKNLFNIYIYMNLIQVQATRNITLEAGIASKTACILQNKPNC